MGGGGGGAAYNDFQTCKRPTEMVILKLNLRAETRGWQGVGDIDTVADHVTHKEYM